ncbi:MAG: molybdenum cofactor biosynthesis protein MoaE [Arachnia propionica]
MREEGVSMPVIHAAITTDPIDQSRLEALVSSAHAGARVSFAGLIRDHDEEAEGVVIGLDYTCHPDADRFLAGVAASVASDLDPEGRAVLAVEHRVGSLGVGEVAIVAVAASAHRREAFDLCQALVDRVKAEVPIWKHQHEASGRASWSGLGLPQ